MSANIDQLLINSTSQASQDFASGNLRVICRVPTVCSIFAPMKCGFRMDSLITLLLQLFLHKFPIGTSTHHLSGSLRAHLPCVYHVLLSRAIGRLRNSFCLQSFAPSALLSPQHVDSAGNRQTELSKVTFCRRLK